MTNQPEERTVTCSLEFDQKEMEDFKAAIAYCKDWEGEPLSVEGFLGLIIEDVLIAHERPGQLPDIQQVITRHFPDYKSIFKDAEEERIYLKFYLCEKGIMTLDESRYRSLDFLRKKKSEHEPEEKQ